LAHIFARGLFFDIFLTQICRKVENFKSKNQFICRNNNTFPKHHFGDFFPPMDGQTWLKIDISFDIGSKFLHTSKRRFVLAGLNQGFESFFDRPL
jgi:hypothetical protein